MVGPRRPAAAVRRRQTRRRWAPDEAPSRPTRAANYAFLALIAGVLEFPLNVALVLDGEVRRPAASARRREGRTESQKTEGEEVLSA